MDAISVLAHTAASSLNSLLSFVSSDSSMSHHNEPEEDLASLTTIVSSTSSDNLNHSSSQSPSPSSTNDSDNEKLIGKGKWTPDEDEMLKISVLNFGGKNWKKISNCLEGRTDVQCLHRWQKVLRPGLIKGPWTKEVT